MIKAREWPVRAMYILIAAALAISLFITAAPAQRVSAAAAVEAKWTRVSTPTTEDFVLAPNSTIVDYALGDAGDVAYAIVYGRNVTGDNYVYWLLKSEDGAATWDDITDALEKVRKTETITELMLVATDWEDAEFVAVALVENSLVRVFVSKDGGTTFKDAGQVLDVVYFDDAEDVSDLAVSLAGADGQRDIAIGGSDNSGYAALFRCTVTGDSASAWHDTTVDTGWDNWYAPNPPAFTSILVTDIIFSPSWETDRTILAVTVTPVPMDGYDVHLQSGTFGETSVAWNKDAGFVNAVLVKDNVGLLIHPLEQFDPRGIAGVALPNDYAGDDPLKRYAWVWVNYIAVDDGLEAIGEIIRVKDGLHTSVREQIGGRPWLTNVSYWGSIAEGKAIAGVLGDGTGGYAVCCDGIQIYHKGGIKDMDICCPAWEPACKLPTGRVGMAVSYVSADKAYAVALQGTVVLPSFEPYDESAWSVSVDGDGIIWNQLSLVDTEISYLSDVAVSPDCNKMMLVSVNAYDMTNYCQCRQGCTGCDSVWLYAEDLPEAEEYSGHWLRTWCGRLVGVNDDHFADHLERGLLRLAPEEDNGDTVYLVDRMTSTIYYNDLETWNCWEKKSAATEISYIVDLAVKDASTIYALGYDGSVAMSDNHGAAITWTDAVKSGVTNGWTIAVRNSDVLVGGQNGDWNYSDDAGETWMKPAPKSPGAGLVTVAFDSYFDTNNVIYAALALGDNGIYRWVIGESEKWE
ncbi:MAG: hypothetical protein MUO61_00855, partial [Dehalococcoidia bacterium]|nr:hypothetical protein [Dehalococcoidia bacterium]